MRVLDWNLNERAVCSLVGIRVSVGELVKPPVRKTGDLWFESWLRHNFFLSKLSSICLSDIQNFNIKTLELLGAQSVHTVFVIGPIFYWVNCDSKYRRYWNMNLLPAARRRRMLRNYWFMQDGARSHRTAEVFDFLQATFRDRIVALDTLAFTAHAVEWPYCSHDLHRSDYTKDIVFKSCNTLGSSYSNFRRNSWIENDVVQKIIAESRWKLNTLIAAEEKHFENLLY